MPQALTGVMFESFVWVPAQRLSKGLVSTGKIQMLMRGGIYRPGEKKISNACSILRQEGSLSFLEVTFSSRQTLFVFLCCPFPASQHINVIVGFKAG